MSEREADVVALGHLQVGSSRVAEQVAAELRRRIVTGEIADGSRLPKEDVLRGAFGVGKPAIREALRILETEGLISVLRGNRGGAVVRLPHVAGIAYSLGLVLTADRVEARDLAMTVREVELLCAGLCAARSDRGETVLPHLRAAHDRAVDTTDPDERRAALRRFHEELAQRCGRHTLTVLAGCLEKLWTGHVRAETSDQQRVSETGRRAVPRPGDTGGATDGDQSVDEHSRIMDAIAAGDIELTERLLAAHLERVQVETTSIDLDGRIDVMAHEIASPGARRGPTARENRPATGGGLDEVASS